MSKPYPSVEFKSKLTGKFQKQEGELSYTYSPFKNLKKESGELTNFTTPDLNFKITNPVNIEVQPSYDGTVNLILNDDINPPRLINSRFTVKEDKKFEIIDRKGDNDTNIYDEKHIDAQTRLFKVTNSIPYVDFLGLDAGGKLKCGDYNFYFKYIDADGNESDIFAESGMISVHEGGINDPKSISGGLLNTNSNKVIKLKLSDLDTSNEYISVYYTRTTGENSYNLIDEYVKLSDKVITGSSELLLTITGFENTQNINSELLNVEYNLVDKVKTQAQIQNMLFFANVDKPNIEYKELTDLSLHIIPNVNNDHELGQLDENYEPIGGNQEDCEYYNMKNVYYYTGYWNNEIYRFGIVYILQDDSLSPVFNIRGADGIGKYSLNENIKIRSNQNINSDVLNDSDEKLGSRNYIPISEDGFLKDGYAPLENILGVCRFNTSSQIISKEKIKPLCISFNIDDFTLRELKKYVKGFFFVRQKRIPTILAQGLTIATDPESHIPFVATSNGPIIESFISQTDDTLTHNFPSRLIDTSNLSLLQTLNFNGIMSPEITLNKAMYTGVLNNTALTFSNGFLNNNDEYLTQADRHFFIKNYKNESPNLETFYSNKVTNIPSEIGIKMAGTVKFSTLAGSAEEPFRVKKVGSTATLENKSKNIIRGIYTNFIGSEGTLPKHKILNLHVPGYSISYMKDYFNVRFNSLSTYNAISDRYNISKLSYGIENKNQYRKSIVNNTIEKKVVFNEYRGDCFINNVTIRMTRNFVDPELPVNDEIIDSENWKNSYLAPGVSSDSRNNANLNRSDINAVNIGHWVTFKVCSSINLALRSLDDSHPDEVAMMGKPRSFYPYTTFDASSSNKMAESDIYNIGYMNTTPTKQYVQVPDVPYLKNIFSNRIMFSEKHVNDAFKNGYRIFQNLQYQDITKQYGAIVKILDWQSNLFIVFENGVALLPVNEKALISTESGQSVHMYGAGVLPEKETPISIDFGSRWSESVIKTPMAVYGVDSEAKKIWRFSQNGFELISDLKIQKFLNSNLKFKNNEHYPIIGIRNIKTHYDNFKSDIIFTFYDYSSKQPVNFNLVFNEKMNTWITRTTWTPIVSENINNLFISMNQQVSRYTYLDAATLKNSIISSGLVLTKNQLIIEDEQDITNGYTKIGKFEIKEGNQIINLIQISAIYSLDNKLIENKYFEIVNNELFTKVNGSVASNEDEDDTLSFAILDDEDENFKGCLLNISYQLENSQTTSYKTIFISAGSEYNENLYLYKHGFANLFENTDDPIPLKWYDSNPDQYNFEFEFIVSDKPYVQKIFDNLKIISNKTQPKELQVWVNGDSYDFIEYNDSTKNNYIDNIFPTHQLIKNLKTEGRVKGNAHYKENTWDIEIKPASYIKNNKKQEFKIRDKYVKIRVIYTGNDPVTITSLQTFYTISYA